MCIFVRQVLNLFTNGSGKLSADANPNDNAGLFGQRGVNKGNAQIVGPVKLYPP